MREQREAHGWSAGRVDEMPSGKQEPWQQNGLYKAMQAERNRWVEGGGEPANARRSCQCQQRLFAPSAGAHTTGRPTPRSRLPHWTVRTRPCPPRLLCHSSSLRTITKVDHDVPAAWNERLLYITDPAWKALPRFLAKKSRLQPYSSSLGVEEGMAHWASARVA